MTDTPTDQPTEAEQQEQQLRDLAKAIFTDPDKTADKTDADADKSPRKPTGWFNPTRGDDE